jgi:DNA-binding helix-hairpin-helix protein with protein kinase domain
MLVTLNNGTLEQYDDDPFAQGGQGSLYLSKDKRSVIKLYHTNSPERVQALHQIIGGFNVTKIEAKSDSKVEHLFAWPNGIVQSPRIGVRMTNVNLQIEHKPLTWWIGARSVKRLAPEIRGNWLDRTMVAVNMARIAWLLHSNGLCHSDFSGDNFLANVAYQHVVLIDLDSLVVPGVLPPEMLGTGDYMAPEIVMGRMMGKQNTDVKPSIYTDLHSLAVLIYQLLLMRHPLKGPKHHDPDAEKDDLLALGEKALYIEDPADRSNRPADPFWGAWLLGDEVEALMRRSFTVGLRNPVQRPLAAEWGDALVRMTEQMVPCSNSACEGKAFVLLRDQPAVCPWCQTKVIRPGTAPVLRLYDSAGQVGHFQPGRGRVVGWQDRTLHRWHIQVGYSERAAVQPEERRPVAKFHFKQNKWYLENLAIPELRVTEQSSVRRVGLDEQFSLEHGQRLMIGTGQSSRLAVVAMQRL